MFHLVISTNNVINRALWSQTAGLSRFLKFPGSGIFCRPWSSVSPLRVKAEALLQEKEFKYLRFVFQWRKNERKIYRPGQHQQYCGCCAGLLRWRSWALKRSSVLVYLHSYLHLWSWTLGGDKEPTVWTWRKLNNTSLKI